MMRRRWNWLTALLLAVLLCVNALVPMAVAEDTEAAGDAVIAETPDTEVPAAPETEAPAEAPEETAEPDAPQEDVPSEPSEDPAEGDKDSGEAIEGAEPDAEDVPSADVAPDAEDSSDAPELIVDVEDSQPAPYAASDLRFTGPSDVTCKVGDTATFSITITSGYIAKYEWQYIDQDGSGWKTTTSAGLTDTYAFTAKAARDGRLIRCIVTDYYGNSYIAGPARLTIVDAAPKIIAQPRDMLNVITNTARFHVSAQGTDLSYKWQYSDDNGATWKTSTTSSGKTDTYTFEGSRERHGRMVRCIVTNGYGQSVTSNTARLFFTIYGAEITAQPKDVTCSLNETAKFTIGAVSYDNSSLTYKWQYSDDNGKTWTASTNANQTATYSTTATAAHNGRMVRCIVIDATRQIVTSSAARLIIKNTKPVISAQPANVTCDLDATATFAIAVNGSGLSYKWQYSDDSGKTWSTSTASSLTTSYAITAKAARHGRLIRCVVSDPYGNSVTSASAQLTIRTAITAQPKDVTCSEGGTAKFTVAAVSPTSLTYKWQYSDDGGRTWKASNNTGMTTTYSTTASAARSGRLIRCVVTDSAGRTVISDAANLTVTGASLKIAAQPTAVRCAQDATATFTVKASGTGLSYTWQYSSDGGKTWINGTGSKTASYAFTASANRHGRLVRCIVKDSSGKSVTSDSAMLLIKNCTPIITTQPANVTCSAGETAKFTVTVASASGTLSYIWQYSDTSGKTWVDSTSASGKTDTYTFAASANRDGRMVRCLVSTPGWQIVSQTAYLTVSDAHTHSWSSSTQAVYVPDQGHYETVTVTDNEAYDERVWVVDKAGQTGTFTCFVCNDCRGVFISTTAYTDHIFEGVCANRGTSGHYIHFYTLEEGHWETVHHAAVTHTEQVWVVDVPAHTRTTTVQKCKTCGATK